MLASRRLSEAEIIAKSDLFRMERHQAVAEIHDQLREFKVHSRGNGLKFLTYLLEMAEIESREILTRSDNDGAD
ncbi:MAG: hypothetical protein ACR2OM_03195 [Aestuariivirgaceae bacterium]